MCSHLDDLRIVAMLKGMDPFLFVAIAQGNFKEVKDLIENQHVNPEPRSDKSFLPVAIAFKQIDIAKYMIYDCGVNVNNTFDGQYPIHMAVDIGNLELVKILVEEKHADPKVYDKDHWNALFFAAQKDYIEIFKYLYEKCNVSPFISAKNGIDLLNFSAKYNHPEIMKYLIEKIGMNPEERNQLNQTPFYVAALENSVKVCKYLYEEAHVDPNCICGFGLTPLHAAYFEGNKEVIDYLLRVCKCDLNFRTFPKFIPGGVTPREMHKLKAFLDKNK